MENVFNWRLSFCPSCCADVCLKLLLKKKSGILIKIKPFNLIFCFKKILEKFAPCEWQLWVCLREDDFQKMPPVSSPMGPQLHWTVGRNQCSPPRFFPIVQWFHVQNWLGRHVEKDIESSSLTRLSLLYGELCPMFPFGNITVLLVLWLLGKRNNADRYNRYIIFYRYICVTPQSI